MKHLVKSDSVSVGPGISYVVGRDKEDLKGDEPSGRKGRTILRRINFRGLPVSIEIEPGQTKKGVDPDGIPWKVKFDVPYGEIDRTEGRDSEPVDVYLGPNSKAGNVFVVHQVRPDGKYDEDKVFLGFTDAIEATKCFFRHGARWAFGSMDCMSFDEFTHGYLAANRMNGSQPIQVKSKLSQASAVMIPKFFDNLQG